MADLEYGPEEACCPHCFGCCIREDHLRPCFTCDPLRYIRFYGQGKRARARAAQRQQIHDLVNRYSE